MAAISWRANESMSIRMAVILKPPAPLPLDTQRPCVFLAGSIEMGRARNWQADLELALADLDVIILNPRRDDWNPSWTQSIDNPQFRQQVEWELAGLEMAQVIAVYFDPGTKSPITLLELGLHARSGKLVVCCPAAFWRRGNVEVVCARYGVTLVEELDNLIEDVRNRCEGMLPGK